MINTLPPGNFQQNQARLAQRQAAGNTGQQFLANHPRFAQRLQQQPVSPAPQPPAPAPQFNPGPPPAAPLAAHQGPSQIGPTTAYQQSQQLGGVGPAAPDQRAQMANVAMGQLQKAPPPVPQQPQPLQQGVNQQGY